MQAALREASRSARDLLLLFLEKLDIKWKWRELLAKSLRTRAAERWLMQSGPEYYYDKALCCHKNCWMIQAKPWFR